jgi:hypothetical protein
MQIIVYLRGLEFTLHQPEQLITTSNSNSIHFNQSISAANQQTIDIHIEIFAVGLRPLFSLSSLQRDDKGQFKSSPKKTKNEVLKKQVGWSMGI